MAQVPSSTDQDSLAPVPPVAVPSPAPETTETLRPMDAGILVPEEPITIPAIALTQAPPPTEVKDSASSSDGARTTKSVGSGTPTPTAVSMSESSASSSAHARRWRMMAFIPFEAHISLVQTRGESGNDKDKGKGRENQVADADPFVSIAPTAARGRRDMDEGSQRRRRLRRLSCGVRRGRWAGRALVLTLRATMHSLPRRCRSHLCSRGFRRARIQHLRWCQWCRQT